MSWQPGEPDTLSLAAGDKHTIVIYHAGCADGFCAARQSGAMLTWDHFNPHNPLPTIVEYVQDRDLWLWKLEESKAYSAALGSYPFDFSLWTNQRLFQVHLGQTKLHPRRTLEKEVVSWR